MELESALRRLLTGCSAAIAATQSKASARCLAALEAHVPPDWRRPRRLMIVLAALEAHVPPKWRRPRRLMIVVAVLLALVVLIIGTKPAPLPRHPAPGTTVFPLGGNQVVLRFVHSTGSVNLSSGPGGQVSITENRNGITDAINTSYQQQGDVITVNVSVENGLYDATWVDFNVAVPQDASANVALAAGTLRTSGLTGNLALQDANGSIWVTNASGAMALQTDSGSINTSHVSGQVSASTNNGTITTVATHLRGSPLMQAQNGTINFHGSLDPGCHAVFRNTSGATGVTLARGSSVLVDAWARSGSINSAFSSVRAATDPGGRVAHGQVGRAAAARLTIQTISGSINLNQGS
jgi:DUF4097 and DUF4098 domain-containing protein YvlB